VLVSVACGCGGGVATSHRGGAETFPEAGSPREDGGAAVTEASSDDASNAVLTPPLSIGAISLWLDGDTGLGMGANGIDRWADRSGLGHVFVAQSALVTDTMVGPHPDPVRSMGHTWVHFNGRQRMVIEEHPTPTQEAALKFGPEGFLLAIVFAGAQANASNDPMDLLVASGPWLGEPPYQMVPPPDGCPALAQLTVTRESLQVQVGMESLTVGPVPDIVNPAGNGAGPIHYVLVMSTWAGIWVRMDGHSWGTPGRSVLPCYQPFYIGDWDFDEPGFIGAVAEVIVVKAPADDTTTKLQKYLGAKYGF
jgi:hypothetical protein